MRRKKNGVLALAGKRFVSCRHPASHSESDIDDEDDAAHGQSSGEEGRISQSPALFAFIFCLLVSVWAFVGRARDAT